MGFLEFLFHLILASAFLWFGRKHHAHFFGTFFVLYGLFRLLIDPLRVDPVRYAGFTIDQYASTIAILLGVYALRRAAFKPRRASALQY